MARPHQSNYRQSSSGVYTAMVTTVDETFEIIAVNPSMFGQYASLERFKFQYYRVGNIKCSYQPTGSLLEAKGTVCVFFVDRGVKVEEVSTWNQWTILDYTRNTGGASFPARTATTFTLRMPRQDQLFYSTGFGDVVTETKIGTPFETQIKLCVAKVGCQDGSIGNIIASSRITFSGRGYTLAAVEATTPGTGKAISGLVLNTINEFTLVTEEDVDKFTELMNNRNTEDPVLKFSYGKGIQYYDAAAKGDVVVPCAANLDSSIEAPDYREVVSACINAPALRWVDMSLLGKQDNILGYFVPTNKWIRTTQLEAIGLKPTKYVYNRPSVDVTNPVNVNVISDVSIVSEEPINVNVVNEDNIGVSDNELLSLFNEVKISA